MRFLINTFTSWNKLRLCLVLHLQLRLVVDDGHFPLPFDPCVSVGY